MAVSATAIRQWRWLLVGVILGVTVVGSLGAFQYWRDSWPFAQPAELLARSEMATNVAHKSDGGGKQSRQQSSVTLDEHGAESIGLRIERVESRRFDQPLRAVATVVPDESRISHIHARYSGWIDQLYINTTGQSVLAGQPVATVYSQDLFASQTEFLAAVRDEKSSPRSVVAAVAKTRLKLLGMSDQEIVEIVRQGQPRKFVTLQSPTSGVVLRRGVSAGASIDPSTEIAAIADLSRVWVWAEIPETASNEVAKGSVASLTFPGAGADISDARVEFVYPTLTERTRTLRVRFAISNAQGLLRPGLYGVAVFKTTPRDALLIPRDAIVDTGQSQHVFISLGRGHFEPRTVVLGARLADRVEVLQGLSPGDEIVAEGVFMLDSESRLRASSGAGTGHAGHGNAKARAEEGNTPRELDKPPVTPHQGHGSQP